MTSMGPQFIPGSTSTHDPAVVWIAQSEYDGLIAIAHRYSNLCQNLLGGGVTQAVIEVLSNNASTSTPAGAGEDLSVQPPALITPAEMPTSYGRTSRAAGAVFQPRHLPHGDRHDHPPFKSWEDWTDAPSEDVSLSMDIPVNATETEENGPSFNGNGIVQHRPRFERVAARSIQLSGFPDDITHADITAIVRGGAVLDLYIRRKDGTASVSFVHGDDAQAFYDYVRKHDLYIRNKRVFAKWSERQFILPGYLAQKLGSGATRNLVIRRCDPSHTEASIREDLEHIHNLVIVKLMFLEGDCYISTNSVANAMFARTCMMSRFKYRGSRIEWDLDECTQPLDHTPTPRRRDPAQIPRQPVANTMSNRFELLGLDD